MNTTTDHAELEARLRTLTQKTLSSPARYFHVAVLVLALIMCSLLGALLVTETDLPGRTQLAFSAMLALGMGWAVYAGWALASRCTLLVYQQVVAGWMAVGGTGAFFVCSAAAAFAGSSTLALIAMVIAGTMLAGALAILGRALRKKRELRALKEHLAGRAKPLSST